jgi:hypothetical protein
MHFEPPKKLASSLKEFASHYLMIVVSILTALVLEQVVLTIHHNSEARHAVHDIQVELKENSEDVRKSMAAHKKQLQDTKTLMAQVLEQIRSGTKLDENQLAALGDQASNINVSTATVRTNAWDAAIASQAVVHMEPQELNRYSSLYASLRDISHYSHQVVSDKILFDSADLKVAAMTHKADLPQIAQYLSRYLLTLTVIENHYQELDELLRPYGGSESAKN